MDSIEIAKNQLSRIDSRPRKRALPQRQEKLEDDGKKTKRGRKAKIASGTKNEVVGLPESADTYTIEWELESAFVEQPIATTLVMKKMIWDPATKVCRDSTIIPISRKKRSEVDKLLGDEGVQSIMRDQQIAIDDNGLLVNVAKASKTRHQRLKQEEPEKTPNDWHPSQLIMRRRSSSFSLEDIEPEEIPIVMEPPKIVDLFQSVKANLNQTLSANFVLNGEPNNNNKVTATVAKKSPPKKEKPGVDEAVTIKCSSDPLSCREMIASLAEQLLNENCKLVLFRPMKFAIQDDLEELRQLLAYLAKYPKPIFAAVQGNVEGVAVATLPLFDLVFAKYGTEFCCAKDPLPGMSILMNSPKVDQNRISEMLFLGESMTSTQAVNCGLINREIACKSDDDYEKKVAHIAKEAVLYSERIRVLKRLWQEKHLQQMIKDLNREAAV